jgi:transaldolase
MTERTTRAAKKQKTGESQLDQLKALTKIVTDTGEIEAIAKFKPVDATTNPSLIYKAALLTEYTHLVDDAVAYGKGNIPTIMVS